MQKFVKEQIEEDRDVEVKTNKAKVVDSIKTEQPKANLKPVRPPLKPLTPPLELHLLKNETLFS